MIIEQFKIFENMQQAKTLLDDMKIPHDDKRFLELKEILKKNLGFMGTFTKWVFKDRENLDRIKDVYDKLKTIQNIDKQVHEFEKLEDLYDYLQEFDSKRKVKQVVKSLPSGRRNLVNDELENLILLNSEDHIIKAIKNLYSKKGGKFHKIEDLIDATKEEIKKAKTFSRDAIMKVIKDNNLKADAIVDTEDLLMLRVHDYEASKKLGSKHWCISTSQSMWNHYVNDFTNQYFVYDFTKDISDRAHMIGTTISPGGKITSGHWADDRTISDLSYIDSLGDD